MAKKIKFPLQMKDDVEVRELDELREHFDLDKVIGYFLDGKLLSWCEARYYDAEADAIRALDKDDAGLHHRLCEIFGVEYHVEEAPKIDVEAVEERNRRLSELKQYTSNPAILEKVDQVAFNQEELADLIDEGYSDIYLCNNSFIIPLRVRNIRYIGIGKAEVVIRSQECVDFDELGIRFENVKFDEAYEKKLHRLPSSFQCPICKASSDKFAKDEKDDSKWICGICGYVHKYFMTDTVKYFCNPCREIRTTWVCDICGYIYESPNDALPQGFLCPICKASSVKFRRE